MAKQIRNDEALHQIVEKLKALRKKTGMLQKTITKETGMNIGNIEAEMTNISITTLERLCRYYGLTLEEFFEDIDL